MLFLRYYDHHILNLVILLSLSYLLLSILNYLRQEMWEVFLEFESHQICSLDCIFSLSQLILLYSSSASIKKANWLALAAIFDKISLWNALSMQSLIYFVFHNYFMSASFLSSFYSFFYSISIKSQEGS